MKARKDTEMWDGMPLDIGHWTLDIGHWALGIGHWALGIEDISIEVH
jgi:hypothetical protein